MLGFGYRTASAEINVPFEHEAADRSTLANVTHLSAESGAAASYTAFLPNAARPNAYLLDQTQTQAQAGVDGLLRGVVRTDGRQFGLVDVRQTATYIEPSGLQSSNGVSGHFEVPVRSGGTTVAMNIGSMPFVIAELHPQQTADETLGEATVYPLLADSATSGSIDIDPSAGAVSFAVGRETVLATVHMDVLAPPTLDGGQSSIRWEVSTSGPVAEVIEPAGAFVQWAGHLPVVSAVLQAS